MRPTPCQVFRDRAFLFCLVRTPRADLALHRCATVGEGVRLQHRVRGALDPHHGVIGRTSRCLAHDAGEVRSRAPPLDLTGPRSLSAASHIVVPQRPRNGESNMVREDGRTAIIELGFCPD